MAGNDDLARRQDTLISILRITHEDAIARTRAEVRKDKAYAAILDLASDWTPAATVRAAVLKTGASARTFGNKTPSFSSAGC